MSAARYCIIQHAVLHVAPGGGSPRMLTSTHPELSRRFIRQFGPANVLLVRPQVALDGWRTRSDAETAAWRALQGAVTTGVVVGGRQFVWAHGKWRDAQCWFVAADVATGDGVRAWHLPDSASMRATPILKLAARLDLMLSKTVPVARVEVGAEAAVSTREEVEDGLLTFSLGRLQLGAASDGAPTSAPASTGQSTGWPALPEMRVRHIPDVRSPSGALMTDGCAPVGRRVMAAAIAGLARRAHAEDADCAITVCAPLGSGGLEEGADQAASLSAALFQGRVGGHKGVWFLDPTLPPDTLCVRPSQRKVDQWQPGTPTQREVEVIRLSRDAGPGRLNLQVAALLAGWGVPTSSLLSLQYAAIAPVLDMCCTEAAARAAFGLPPRGEGRPTARGDELSRRLFRSLLATPLSASSSAWAETLARCMLVAGLWGDFRLTSLLQKARERRLKALARRLDGTPTALAIPVAKSRTAYVLADPTGLLAPGECYFRPSSLGAVVTGPVLLARNPCHHPDHLQAATGTSFVAALRRLAGASPLSEAAAQSYEEALVDVLVLPVTGDSPLVGLLSGGDYDGDTVWVCWEEALTAPVVKAKAEWVVPSSPQHMPGPPAVPGAPGSAQHATWPPSASAFASVYLNSLRPDAPAAGSLGLATNLHLAWVDFHLAAEEVASAQARQAAASVDDGWGFTADEAIGRAASMASPAAASTRALWQPQCLQLAAIAAALVDAPKIGGAVPIPAALRTVVYPHYMRWKKAAAASVRGGAGAKPAAEGPPTVHSVSPLGALADASVGLLARIRKVIAEGQKGSAAAPPVTSLSAADAALLEPWLLARTRYRPHPAIVAAADAAGWLSYAPEAERHFEAFKADIAELGRGQGCQAGPQSRPSSVGSDASGGGESDSYGGGATSGMESDAASSSEGGPWWRRTEGGLLGGAWDDEEGDEGDVDGEPGKGAAGSVPPAATAAGGGAHVHPAELAEQRRLELRIRGRVRLLYAPPPPSARPLGGGAAVLPARREPSAVTGLALAYYMIAWYRYRDAVEWAQRGGPGARPGRPVRSPEQVEPYAFPWTIADAELLEAVAA